MIVNNLLINKSMNMQMICVFHGDLWGLGKEKKKKKGKIVVLHARVFGIFSSSCYVW